MTLPVRLTSAAVRNPALAERWYLDEAPRVLTSFEEEIDRAFDRISERPESYRIVESTVRRALARKFPFSVFYPRVDRSRCRRAQSRDPRTWQRRV